MNGYFYYGLVGDYEHESPAPIFIKSKLLFKKGDMVTLKEEDGEGGLYTIETNSVCASETLPIIKMLEDYFGKPKELYAVYSQYVVDQYKEGEQANDTL